MTGFVPGGAWRAALCVMAFPAAIAQAQVAPASTTTAPPERVSFVAALSGGFEMGSAPTDIGQASAAQNSESQLQIGWLYPRRWRSGSISVAGQSSARYLPNIREVPFANHGLNISGEWRTGRRTVVGFAEQVSYAPLTVFPGVGEAPLGGPLAADSATGAQMTLRHGGALSVARVMGPRTSATLGLEYTAGRAADGAAALSHLAYAGVRRRLSSSATLRTGYGFGTYQFGADSQPTLRHQIDIGVDFSRPLPMARRTVIEFRTGSVLLTRGTTAFRLDLSAAIKRPFGRHWVARVGYDRPMQFIEGFSEPLLSDAVSMTTEGSLGRFVRVVGGFSASQGTVGGSADAAFSSIGGSAQVHLAVSRQWSWVTEFADFHYRFSENAPLPGQVPRDVRRRAVRSGLALSLGSFSRPF
jgi:hypothetical protein